MIITIRQKNVEKLKNEHQTKTNVMNKIQTIVK